MKNIRRSIYQLLALFDTLLKRKLSLCILCYHAIGEDDWRYSHNLATFEKHIDILSKKYTFVSLDQINTFLHSKTYLDLPAACITFDDGYKDILSVVPVCKKYNIKPTVFVLTSPNKKDISQLQTSRELLSKKDIVYLKKFGWIIGSHSATHTNFTKLSSKNTQFEIKRKANMKYFAYPKGIYTKEIITAIQNEDYQLACSAAPGEVTQKSNPFTLPRILCDRSHSVREFTYLLSPSVCWFRTMGLKIYAF